MVNSKRYWNPLTNEEVIKFDFIEKLVCISPVPSIKNMSCRRSKQLKQTNVSSKRKHRSTSKITCKIPKQRRRTRGDGKVGPSASEEKSSGEDTDTAVKPEAQRRDADRNEFNDELDVFFSKYQESTGQQSDSLLQRLCRDAMTVCKFGIHVLADDVLCHVLQLCLFMLWMQALFGAQETQARCILSKGTRALDNHAQLRHTFEDTPQWLLADGAQDKVFGFKARAVASHLLHSAVQNIVNTVAPCTTVADQTINVLTKHPFCKRVPQIGKITFREKTFSSKCVEAGSIGRILSQTPTLTYAVFSTRCDATKSDNNVQNDATLATVPHTHGIFTGTLEVIGPPEGETTFDDSAKKVTSKPTRVRISMQRGKSFVPMSSSKDSAALSFVEEYAVSS